MPGEACLWNACRREPAPPNSAPGTPTNPADVVLTLLRSRSYQILLVIAALLGVPVAVVAYWFLYLVNDLQKLILLGFPWVIPDLVEPAQSVARS